MKIRILVAGGTFDKNYDEIEQKLVFNKTHVPEMLELGRSKLNVNVETVMLIDSLYMKNEHREKILKKCLECKEDKIVITHGTDTVPDTARFLSESIKNKTIVLTGAIVPYTFRSSDGLFNLGSALSFVQVLPPGIYVAMNGRVFDSEKVKKNKLNGNFEEI